MKSDDMDIELTDDLTEVVNLDAGTSGKKKRISFQAELEKEEDMNHLTRKELCETLLHGTHGVLRVGTCSNNTKGTFVALLKAAAKAFRVDQPRVRNSKTGGLVMEVVWEGKEKKAEELSRSHHAILGNKAVRISRCPKKVAELKVMHLDESVQKEELTARVAEAAEYSIMDAKIQLTQAKSLRCYRSLQEGHVGAKCPTGPTEIKYLRGSGTGHGGQLSARPSLRSVSEERTGGAQENPTVLL
ncbi:UNVERIFIED_CONTAM: hypothetical protein PYX00_008832 [Menopon gallinae]|uniref:Uncharacterized protein n=1 Tax=Menopon gallinae TaxID=328185 RepID=A0AAW2HPT3_9NEOP